MKKLKIVTLAVIGATIAVLFALRMQYAHKDELETLDLALYGITDGIGINRGDIVDGIYVTFPGSVDVTDIISVSSAPEVAYLQLDRNSVAEDRLIHAKLIAVSDGVTEVFVRSSDGSLNSEKYSVCVWSEESGKVSEEATASSESRRNGFVYVTMNGSKYHLSQKCAGENAKEISLTEAVNKGYSPCKNCAINK